MRLNFAVTALNLFTPHIGIAAEKNHFEVLPGLPLMACATTKLNEAFMLVARTITVKPQKLRVCFFAPPLANRPFDTDNIGNPKLFMGWPRAVRKARAPDGE